jgi:outer membrane protein TolC
MELRQQIVLAAVLAGALPGMTWAQAVQTAVTPIADSMKVAGQTISLDEAIRLAQANEPTFRAAEAESRALSIERTNARAALLPSATYHNQVLYTQPSGQVARFGDIVGAPTPIFIANNAIREYASQGVFNETIGFQQIGAIRSADATAARAAAEAEVARRGLVNSVVTLYYTTASQRAKLATAQRALDEANRFVRTTQQREAAREAAHADVLKAHLQQQQRERELDDVKLASDRGRLELGVLLFTDPATPFQTEPAIVATLGERQSVEAAARENNPELRSALASVQISEADVYLARAAFLPDLGVNVTYGIDAAQVAVNGPRGVRNLGYSGSVSLDIPVWDWLTTERRLKESKIRREAAKTMLTAAQRRLLADLSEFYDEAAVAQKQLASLDESVASARESLRLTNLRYVNGESTVLEVVDAQNTLTSTEAAQADGTLRYHVAFAQLQTLTGSL